MQSHQEAHSLLADGLLKATNHVGLRSHSGSVPLSVLSIPHRKAVVMFPDRAGVLRTSLLEQLCPLIRIEFFGGKHRDEIFPTEFFWSTIGLNVVFPLGSPFPVHVIGIPGRIRTFCRDTVNAPMSVNAKLGILKPLRGGMLDERSPGGFKKLWCLHRLISYFQSRSEERRV